MLVLALTPLTLALAFGTRVAPSAERGELMALDERKRERGTKEGIARAARMANVAAGLWLAISVSLMQIPTLAKMPWIAGGVAIVVLAFGALFVEPRLRIGNLVVSLLLLGAMVVLPIGEGVLMLDVLVAATLVLGCSLVPDGWEDPVEATDLRRAPPQPT